MSVPSILLKYDSLQKTLKALGSFGAGDSVSIELSPAIIGTQVVSLQRAGVELAQDEITDGAGILELSTDAIKAVFSGTPLHHSVTADIQAHDESGGLLGSGKVVIKNTADAFSVLRTANAGVLSGTLAETLAAGTPVKRSAAGLIEGCSAAYAADYLGILKTGGASGTAAKIVTAGIAVIPDWGLSAGATYYIARNASAITATVPEGYNVRPVGIAVDADTLVILNAPVVETAAGDYLVFDVATRRFKTAAALDASAGAESAGAVVKLDAAGKIDASMVPDVSAAALAAVAAAFTGKIPLDDPDGDELLARLNEISEALRTLGV